MPTFIQYYLPTIFWHSIYIGSIHTMATWALILILGIAVPISVLISLFSVIRRRFPPVDHGLDIKKSSSRLVSLDTTLSVIIALFVVLPAVYAARHLMQISDRGVATLSLVVVASVGSVTELLSFQMHYKRMPWKQVGLTWVLAMGIIMLVFSVRTI